ncbi:MAG TPA: OadG family protein [Longimicrobiales bacterium]|nr:OadG family protein [Longimicrobiales bacterium]
MILEGLRLVVLGMVTVFVFLILLVWLMSGSAWFFRRFGHLFPEPSPLASPTAAAVDAGGADRARVAAMIAAVHAHRARRRG